MTDTNLTGVWHAAKATILHLIEEDRGDSINVTGSSAVLFAQAIHRPIRVWAQVRHGRRRATNGRNDCDDIG